MYQELRDNFKNTFGTDLVITDDEIHAQIMLNPELGSQMMDAENQGTMDDFLRANMSAILETLKTGDAVPGTAAAPAPGAKKTKTVVEPSEDFKDLSKGQSALLERKVTENLPERERNSKTARITGVIIAKPCPMDWMKDVPQCAPNTKTKSYEELKKFDPAGADAQMDIMQWLANNPDGKSIIPTSAQLRALGEEHKKRWETAQSKKTTKSGKAATYKAPDWADGDNQDEHLSTILAQLGDAAGLFDVLVATMDGDPTVGAKPWHWTTRGFQIETKGEDGSASTMLVSSEGLLDFLMQKTVGYMVSDTEKGIDARLVNYRPRAKAGETQRAEVRARVRNNRTIDGNAPTLIPALKLANNGKETKSGQKSVLYYYVVRTVASKSDSNSSEVQFRVTRRRVSLVWEHTPAFVADTEILDKVGGSLKGITDSRTPKSLASKKQDFETLIRNAYAQAAMADSTANLTNEQKALKAEFAAQLASDAAAEANAMA